MKFFLVSLILTTAALAHPGHHQYSKHDLDKRPPAFMTNEGRAVFADFKRASYEVIYDLNREEAFVEATILLETAEDGLIVFDSHQEPTEVLLNGVSTHARLIATPDKTTLLRTVSGSVPAGTHVLHVKVPLKVSLEFREDGVRSAFWMGDLEDRNYIEKYLPTNFIFDRVPMILRVKFIGGQDNQRIYTNGNVEKTGVNKYTVAFEEGYNITCPYFHTVPVGTFLEREFVYTTIDNRRLPSVIYIAKDTAKPQERLDHLQNLTEEIMRELEADYGPFPHQSLTIYNNSPSGGMEYSGATITSESALGHELFHSYFARGVMPADGNSGWIDEALARWRDRGYARIYSLQGSSKMANLGTYSRLTDREAYSFGERFMAYLDGKLAPVGGLKPFLRHLVQTKTFDPMSTEDFISELKAFTGIDFTRDFHQYVYGLGNEKSRALPLERDLGVHRQFTEEELNGML